MLEDHAHAPANPIDVAARGRDGLPPEEDRAGARLLHPVQAAQEGALPGARRADDRQPFPLRHRGIDAVQHGDAPKLLAQAANLDQRFAAAE